MESTEAQRSVLRVVMNRWKVAVDAHRPEEVAECFTEDAIFQGLRPYSVGHPGIVQYYDSQPLGLTAEYEVLETRALAEDVLLGYLSVDFSFTDRPTIPVTLGVVLRRQAGEWYIGHYQVARRD
ncbi:nuclear transport factor 2 family protein [Streptomyces sp. NBC_00687]|uniref:nuclear transport factor 2 family protein n=1 Tax=Streptomyces sp. NBC_00687 TaxID=2975807 RepID=UPI0022563E3E|nr:nuclear transport factor 2 family protein [Streptomyces sp. NBC_00687]MCX4912014.1 nuclear transport factor 2 family protein [Streptomyces sp. NBC_00687]